MTRFPVLKILTMFLLGSLSANLLVGQELPELEDGYVDITVLQTQVDRNSKDIQQIKSVLNLKSSTGALSERPIASGVYFAPPPAISPQFGPVVWQSPVVSSTIWSF